MRISLKKSTQSWIVDPTVHMGDQALRSHHNPNQLFLSTYFYCFFNFYKDN